MRLLLGLLLPVFSALAGYEIASFPFHYQGNTKNSDLDNFNRYNCKPGARQFGKEMVFSFTIDEDSVVSARVYDDYKRNVDVDLHVLKDFDPNSCLYRGHRDLSGPLKAGKYYLIVDSYTPRGRSPREGEFRLSVNTRPLPKISCSARPYKMRMNWRSCHSSVKECENTNGKRYLNLPSTGRMVKEAHLVTVKDDFPNAQCRSSRGWPSSMRHKIREHYRMSEKLSSYFFTQRSSWAPAEPTIGKAAYCSKLPAKAESWYVNMHWKRRPKAGTKMIVKNPLNGRAVVVAAGYETGPGSNTAIGGVVEEVHHYLRTGHRSKMTLIYPDEDLSDIPYGPVKCIN